MDNIIIRRINTEEFEISKVVRLVKVTTREEAFRIREEWVKRADQSLDFSEWWQAVGEMRVLEDADAKNK